MLPDELVFSISRLDGVYAALHSCLQGEEITAQVPEGWTLEVAQSLAHRGIRALETARERIPDCHEVRVDSDYVSIFIHSVRRGYIFTLVNVPESAAEVGQTVERMAQDFKPDPVPRSMAPFDKKELTSLIEKTGPATPLPMVTMPVTVHAARGARYINEQPIGEGGTAVVSKAYDLRLNRQVALKRFKPHRENTHEEEDYLAEMESASRIRHHNVLSTFDADIDIQGRYIVMQLIDGEDLEKRTRHRTMREEFRDFALQALDGLAATHEAGLLHLDLKPSNIMVTESATGLLHTTLIDYGKARSLVSDDREGPPKGAGLVGSIHYCSPESLNQEEVTPASDLYSLGCVFYFALTGRHAFSGEGAVGVMAAHMQNRVAPLTEALPGIDPTTAEAIMALLQLDPKDRPSDVTEASRLFRKIPNQVITDS